MTGAARPLEGRAVLVTRAASQSGALSQHLRHLGAAVVEVPALAIQPVATLEEIRAAAARLRARRPPRWMAVTSANAVERLAELVPLDELAGVRAAAVGESTARALRGIGVNVELVAPGTGAAALGEQLIAAGASRGSVWVPQAEAARGELVELLRARGADVEVTVCYRTVRIPGLGEALAAALRRGVDALILLSPSAAEAVLAAAGPEALGGLTVVCGGETTAAAVRAHGLAPVVAGRSDPEAVAAALVLALGERGGAPPLLP
jgi:uroporphyrinogen III methyltransferase/synthase